MFNKIRSNIILDNLSIEDAINKMELSEKKILLVVTKKNKFIGTVTDGDFRRFFLMNDKNYKLPISLLASKNANELKKVFSMLPEFKAANIGKLINTKSQYIRCEMNLF